MDLQAAEARIPPHLRINFIQFNYRGYCTEHAFEEGFEWVQRYLQPFKQALTGSKLKFLGKTGNEWTFDVDKGVFKDSSTLLDHIDKLLQLFTRCRAYSFNIGLYINENSSSNVLAALLQFDAIIRCSKIKVEFVSRSREQTRLPIETIGNWLNRTNANGQEDSEDTERFLKLKLHCVVLNVSEMFEYLKKVCHFFVKLL